MCKQPRTITLQEVRIIDGVSLSNQQAVPCGQCALCAKRKVSDWMVRWTYEMERSERPLFVTLTYNREHVPKKTIEITDKDTGEIKERTITTLQKTDLQKFMKRLRYYDKAEKEWRRKNPIRYIACGEYGSKGGRPHYHIIIVNVMDNWEILKAWENKGRITIDPLKEGGLKYVLKYINKSNKKHKLQEKEFRISSAKIGDNYISMSEKWHKESAKNSFVRINGKPAAMPKYYKDKIYTKAERARVTEHQRIRQQEKITEKIKKIMRTYPKISEEKAIKILEVRIDNITLAKRNEKI